MLEYQEQFINNKVTKHCNINNNNSSKDSCNYRLEDCNNNINSNKKKTKYIKRKVIWFDTAFCKLSYINIGKYFLKLIDRRFNKVNPLNKIFNWKTLKISYSCMNNASKIIYNHYKYLIDK